MNRILTTLAGCLLLLLLAAQISRAQEGLALSHALASSATDPAARADRKEAGGAGAPTTPQNQTECRLCRWFELQTATISTRYRFVENSAGVTTNDQLQHSEVFKGRLKFDAEGRYSLNAGVATGNNFTGSWNNTGWGTGRGATNLYLKQLFLSAKPVKGLELQYGGLSLLRGESTEITSYDNDAYIVGQRLSLKRPEHVFFDEIAVTYAYLGDITTPNLNKRYHRLQESNYHQFLVSKSFGKRAVVSADYTFQAGTETMREAVKVHTKELRVIDAFRFENYQRMDVNPDYGFAVAGEKTLFKRLTLGGGFASIDPNYGGLNADRFNKGQRLFVSGGFRLSPEFGVSTFLTRAVDNSFAVSNRTRLDVVFSYDLLRSLQRTGLF